MSGLWEFARHFASSGDDTVVCSEGVLHMVGETSLLHYLLESSSAPPSAQLGTALSAWDLYKKSYDEIEPSFKKSPRARHRWGLELDRVEVHCNNKNRIRISSPDSVYIQWENEHDFDIRTSTPVQSSCSGFSSVIRFGMV